MKHMFAILVSAALLLGALSGCQTAEPAASLPPAREWTVSKLAELALEHSGREDMGGLEELCADSDREALTVYLENAYGLEQSWEEAAVIRAAGASAFEIAVLRMGDSEAAVRASTALMSYIFARQGDFAGYAPGEADMAANGSIMQNGPFAALFICPDPNGAYKALEAALSGEHGPGQPEPSQGITEDVKELRDLLVAGQGVDREELEWLDDGGQSALDAYVKDVYGLAPEQWEECAAARGTGDSAFEIAVLRAPRNWEVLGEVEQALNRYLDRREAEFDQSSEQARLLHGAIAGGSSPYVVLLACRDRTGAIETFLAAAGVMGFGYSPRYRYLDTDPDYPDRCKFTPPNQDDMSLYDTSAIRAAWERGDPSGLSQYDRDIYDRAQQVLEKALKNGMSDYEKEKAIYGWIVQNVNYDWTHQDRMKATPRESFTPYGGLVNHTAVCLGYATTFQLLCDLAGVECITVTGAAFSSREDHGWNMVRLDGEWYCADVTWDANDREYGGQGRWENWSYFNITSDEMADTDHQWDYANIPEATAEDRGRG